MLNAGNNKKRMAIFMFYDEEGKADAYIFFQLSELRKHAECIQVVCNGRLTEDSKKNFEKFADDVLIRENEGYDVEAYRQGILHQGFEKLAEYDELILLNYTFFGPLFSWEEMFSEMERRELDFWGITKHFKMTPDPFGRNTKGYLPEHIQSYFMVLNKTLFLSESYKEFLTNLETPQSYLDSICNYESVFTEYFEDKGFTWDVYVNLEEYSEESATPVMFYIHELIEQKRCPVIKRRAFFSDYHDYYLNSGGESTKEAYRIIKEKTEYDINLIWENILRVNNLADIQKNMQLWYSVSQNGEMDYNNKYVLEIEKDFQKKINLWIEKENNQEFFFVAVPIENIYGKHIVSKKSLDYNRRKNLFCNEAYVKEAEKLFFQEERLGMLVAPPLINGREGMERQKLWETSFEKIEQLLKAHKMKISLQADKIPYFPSAGAFCISRKAAESLEKYQDIFNQCTEAEACCIMPLLLQKEGYYTGVILNEEYVATEIVNLEHRGQFLQKNLETLQKELEDKREQLQKTEGELALMAQRPLYYWMKKVVKKVLPSWIIEKIKRK